MTRTQTTLELTTGVRPRVPVAVGPLPSGQESAELPNTQRDDGPAERMAFSVAEAALITGLSRDLLYDQMRAGRLAYLKVGRRRIITRQNLDTFLATAL
jgi:excisionase family DNA binding protein